MGILVILKNSTQEKHNHFLIHHSSQSVDPKDPKVRKCEKEFLTTVRIV